MGRGDPISYLVLQPGTTVVTRDGEPVGTVKRVLAIPDEDVFDGLIIDTPAGDRFVDAEGVAEIYEGELVLALSAGEAEDLPDPEPSPAQLEVDPDTAAGRTTAGDRIRRAWDLISGNY
jgi:hypothetical protein